MSTGNLIRDAWEVVPITMLLLVGGAVAVLSGVKGRSGPFTSAWRLAGNTLVVLARTLLYVIALLVVQQIIGSAPGRGW